MQVMIISDLDVQLIMLLLDDVRLEVYFLTKKKKKRKSILSLYVELFEYYNGLLWKVQCIILTILWRPFLLKLDFDSLWQLELSCKVIKKCLCIFIME